MAVPLFRIFAVRPTFCFTQILSESNRVHLLKMSTSEENSETPLIPLKEGRRFIVECLQAVGTPQKHAEAQADLLIEADYRGHFSHGMNRLQMYINDITSKTCDAKAVPKILQETPATAWVDGQNGLGAVVGNFCMDLAIKKAQTVGVGWVCAKESNHYGIAGMYAMQAMRQGLLGMSFTNSSPFMCPTRCKKAALGTNPLSLATPSKNDDNFVLDMATTSVAVGKIEIQRRKEKDAPIPEGWAQDHEGKITTDANVAYDAGLLMPLGGSEVHSGYKGFGLGMLVEIFCGILAGSNYGTNIRKWGNSIDKANLGQCFIAVDPKCFAPGFEDRMSDLMDTIRNCEPVDPSKPVLIAGDPERNHMKFVDSVGGVRYVKNQINTCKQLAEKLCVKPLNS
ncbi:hypothetical protein RI129_008634 [Pyrocoelia pectoralis]|uniref:Malate dehydrogenase n=1 Tax=Pyrocoelia pectoralis TaxID=417401 RepID=A0AAN7ZG70_9COLE